MTRRLHFLGLIGILSIGTGLRFWNLESKALWLDEVITAIFSLGKSPEDIPFDTFVSLTDLDSLFTFRAASCPQIAQAVAIHSVHPPLFFCLMHQWLGWLQPEPDQLAYALRAFPALMGVVAIAAMYWLGRIAFSPAAGLMGAALMAVSPFAVYLSQEARHYTLPMTLIVLALVGLVSIQQDLQRQRLRPTVWLSWIGVNGIGLYVHYFFILAVVAQGVTLLGLLIWRLRPVRPRDWWVSLGALTAIGLIYLPWLPTLLGHLQRSETNWLNRQSTAGLAQLEPLMRTLAGWILMVIMPPVEDQPLSIIIPLALLLLGFLGWFGLQLAAGYSCLQRYADQRLSAWTITGFTLCVLIEFFGIVYILNKDLTLAPRYNFVYYPGICCFIGACFAQRWDPQPRRFGQTIQKRRIPAGHLLKFFYAPLLALSTAQKGVLLAGLASAICVVNNLAFHKPFYPLKVAHEMAAQPNQSLALVVGYQTPLQEGALGLSYALAVRQVYPRSNQPPQFALLKWEKDSNFQLPWQTLVSQSQPLKPPLNLWVVGKPSMAQANFPAQLSLASSQIPANGLSSDCKKTPEQYGKIGFPYQLYQCP